jgi:predicted ATPase
MSFDVDEVGVSIASIDELHGESDMRVVSFRIYNFKSIQDSRECDLSPDHITVLAGQNEAGKSAMLEAMRDFDFGPDKETGATDAVPDSNMEAHPSVWVKFSIEEEELKEFLDSEFEDIPSSVRADLNQSKTIWVGRDMISNQFSLEPAIQDQWPDDSALSVSNFLLHFYRAWPKFVHFSAFDDSLPREVLLSDLQDQEKLDSEYSIVRDFIELSKLDINRVATLADDDKLLNNYLSTISANITGDFLNYWLQKVDGISSVVLRVRHARNRSGDSKLQFFIESKGIEQYADQRSKGFLWFLSFFLRLAANQERYSWPATVLLIDEPGSYLHARAQADILSVFEKRLDSTFQIVYSTHSPYMIPSDKLHRLRVVLNDPKEGSVALDRLTDPLLQKEAAAETLSPILTAIGLDIRQAVSIANEYNLIVEGISDYYYLSSWIQQYRTGLAEKLNIIPSTGASRTIALASILVGWGIQFAVLVDNDDDGNKARNELHEKLDIPVSRLLRLKDAGAIEDIFTRGDFANVLPNEATQSGNEKPTTTIRRVGLNKVILANSYIGMVAAGSIHLSPETIASISQLMDSIESLLPTTEKAVPV